MERILIGLCVFLCGAIFAVEGSCTIGTQMNGVWIGVLHNQDTKDWIDITQSNTIYVNVRGTVETYVCIEENQYGSEYLWKTENGNGYLCVYRVDMMDDTIQYSFLTNTGKFAPEVVDHTMEHCGKARRHPALDIRRSYEHQLQA